jgi:hypothetical protein
MTRVCTPEVSPVDSGRGEQRVAHQVSSWTGSPPFDPRTTREYSSRHVGSAQETSGYGWLYTLYAVLEGVLDSVGVGGVARGQLFACRATLS